MAVTVTNNLTTVNTAESTTGWAATGSAASLTLNGDIFKVGSNALSCRLDGGGGNDATGGIELTISSTDFSNNVFYFWAQTTSVLFSTGGIRFRLGDGTNFSTWFVADVSTYPGGFQRYVVDVNETPDLDNGGTPVTITAVTTIRVEFRVTTDIMGNIPTIWVDQIDRQPSGTTHAISVSGGLTGDRGTWQEINDDTTNVDLGIVRKVGGVFQVNGPIEFGTTTASDTFFEDTDSIVVFQDQVVPNNFYDIQVVGGSGNNVFILGAVTGSGSSAIGSNGNIITSAGPTWTLTANETDIDEFKLYGCTLANMGLVSIGDTTTALGTTGDTVDLVDNSFVSADQVISNIGADTFNILRNKIAFSTNTVASLDMIDSNDVDVDNWQIIGAAASSGSGFEKSTAGTVTRNVSNHNFNQMDKPYVTLLANQTWNSVNPTWTITDQTELDFGGSTLTGAEVNENFDLDITVQQPDGTKIQNSNTWLVETSPSVAAPTANRQATDAQGEATSDILKRNYVGAAASALTTTLHDDQTLKVYFHGRIPFVSLLSVTGPQTPTVTLVTDSNVSETNQATAISNGSGITVDRDATDPHSLLEFTGGSGTDLAAGNTITGDSSGAVGTVVEIPEGAADSSGRVFLDTRNGNAFTNGEGLTAAAGTGPVTTWTGTAAASNAERRYSWNIDCNGYSMQILYDYINAQMADDDASIPTIYRDAIIWGEDENALLVQVGTTGYKTERTVRLTEGVFLSNRGVGTIQYMTADDGFQFTPPTTVTLEINGVEPGARCYIEALSGGPETAGTELMREEANGSGVAQEPYSYTSNQPVLLRARLRGWLPFQATGTITSAGLTVTAVFLRDTIVN